jgi:predicted TIM-barrel enzyme/DNA-binding NtrC family response regulator
MSERRDSWSLDISARKIVSRRSIRMQFQTVRDRGEFLVGAAVGAGLFAEAAERGGADFVLALSAGRLRLMGAASIACMLPICDSNAFVASFGANEFVGRCSIPIFFGASVMTHDRAAEEIAASIAKLGFAGVMNFPTAVHYPSATQAALELCGLGFGKELELLKSAQALDLWTVCHVRTREQAQRAAAAGVDMVCFIYGWNAGGRRGMASAITLREAALLAREVAKVVHHENRETFLVLEGGPIEKVEDLLPIYRSAHIGGYVGGSTIDRLPLEDAVVNQTLRFKTAAAATRKRNAQARALIAFGRSLGLVGSSRRMLELYQDIRQGARSSAKFAFIITGEPGTGRQFVAETLFRLGGGDLNQLMTVDASEISTQRLLVAVFGRHELRDGAAGRAEISGVIIRGLEDVSAHTQRRVARLLAKGTFRAVGSKREETGALRLIFISSKSMQVLSQEGELDPELHRELESREIAVPALREYVEDIEDIVADMAKRLAPRRTVASKLSPAALRRLQIHEWPGNLAELRTFVTHMVASMTTEWIDDATAAQLLGTEGKRAARPASERDVILDALWRHGFHRGRTSCFLGISRKTLFNKIRRFGLRG